MYQLERNMISISFTVTTANIRYPLPEDKPIKTCKGPVKTQPLQVFYKFYLRDIKDNLNEDSDVPSHS